MAAADPRCCVLVGGGHAHVQVLASWAKDPVPNVRLVLIVDRPKAIYSGMVPGWVAGDYASTDLEIDVVALAHRAGAQVVLAPAIAVDPVAQRIALEGAPAVSYDVASLDVGSSVRGLDLPGAQSHALATRPIGCFVHEFASRLDTARAHGQALRIVVIGAGIAGVELVFTLEARLRREQRPAHLTVVGDPSVLPDAPTLAGVFPRIARARGIDLIAPFRVTGIDAQTVYAEQGSIACDLPILAAGAVPHPWLVSSPMPTDAAGFVEVAPTLTVLGHDTLFAVGDCASLRHAPRTPKAGVYAVRMGPVLDANLRHRLRGEPMIEYQPQRDFLALLNLGERRAIGSKWGMRVQGRWVWKLKDHIDRRFMRRFQSPSA